MPDFSCWFYNHWSKSLTQIMDVWQILIFLRFKKISLFLVYLLFLRASFIIVFRFLLNSFNSRVCLLPVQSKQTPCPSLYSKHKQKKILSRLNNASLKASSSFACSKESYLLAFKIYFYSLNELISNDKNFFSIFCFISTSSIFSCFLFFADPGHTFAVYIYLSH